MRAIQITGSPLSPSLSSKHKVAKAMSSTSSLASAGALAATAAVAGTAAADVLLERELQEWFACLLEPEQEVPAAATSKEDRFWKEFNSNRSAEEQEYWASLLQILHE